MRIFSIAVATAAALLAVPVLAQGGPPPDPYGDAAVTKADVEKAATDRFVTLDVNKDGSLTPEERRAGGPGGGGGFRGGGGAGGPPPAQTVAEYVTAQSGRFDQQDADHDGKLTKAERDAFRAAMIARFQQGGGAQ
ncbi:MAG: hypothetical protein ABIT09_07545 [Croceibacterium sp.]